MSDSVTIACAALCLAGFTAMASAQGTVPPVKRPPAGAFNLRVLSDSTPDWSTRANFVRSARSGWKTNQEKALAQFRWLYLARRVGNCAYEDGRPVLDPVLFFNSYGVTYCRMISELNCSLWEAQGWPGRCIDLPGHIVSEAFYDGGWHLFDNDFYQHYVNEKGAVASAEDLEKSRIHGNVADLKPGEYYLYDHCPTASAPRGRVFMGPSSWSIIDVGKDWYPPGQVKPRLDVVGAHAGHRFILGLRPNETYTRHWRPLGTGDLYARPLNNGKGDPMDQATRMRNSRSNGQWVWTPDLSDPAVPFAAENIECAKVGIRVKDADKPGSVVFRVMAANVATSATFDVQFDGSPALSISASNGVTWDALSMKNDKEGVGVASVGSVIAGRLEYLLKVELTKKGDLLKKLTLTTVTQVNPRALPALRLGSNKVVAVSDEHLEYVTFNPRLSAGQHLKEVSKATGWQSIEKPQSWIASLFGLDQPELVLSAETPGDVKRVRMACTAHLTEPGTDFMLSINAGKAWKELGRVLFTGGPYDRRVSVETGEFEPGVRQVKMRYAYETGGAGLVNVFAEVGYVPAGGFMPYDVTYCWDEWRDGKWVERQHVARITSPFQEYSINVGGERPPRMNWLRIAPAGEGRTGYSDGQDVGEKFARPVMSIQYGRNLAAGCKYEVSRPASDAFPDTTGKVLTDGYIGLADVRRMANINPTGERGKELLGELVVWGPGEELLITVDLGEAKEVSGARVCAVGPNQSVRFPDKMIVELSTDGKEFSAAGQAQWQDCFFPPAERQHWEGFDSPLYDGLQAGGIIDFCFPIVLAKADKARYVRFRFSPQAIGAAVGEGGKAGMALWELEVFDRVRRQPWSDRIQLPVGPSVP